MHAPLSLAFLWAMYGKVMCSISQGVREHFCNEYLPEKCGEYGPEGCRGNIKWRAYRMVPKGGNLAFNQISIETGEEERRLNMFVKK